MNKEVKKRGLYYMLLAIGVLIYMAVVTAVAYLVVKLVSQNGIYPSGSDTMYHIYRGDYVYKAVKNGNWYPLYDSMWYNGVELMRYWAPLAAYFMAFCQMLAGGDMLLGYLIFVGFICILGAIPWLYIGIKMKRYWLGAFIGILWFFMPNNLLALFVEGNLARSLSMIFLPIFIYQVSEYLKDSKVNRLPFVMISFVLIALCHLGYAGMTALAVLLYCVIHMLQGYSKKAVGQIIVTILLSFMLIGIWMVASLNGGITSLDNSENMANFFQKLSVTLNPFDRIESNNSHFYFGLAATLIAANGIFFGYKKSRTGFMAAIITLICTTTAMYPVLKILPGSQYLWMLRFISIALCMILYSFLKWDTLRKPIAVIFCIALIVDVIPSLNLITGEQSNVNAADRLDELQSSTLITQAQEITTQRLALLDDSTLGSAGALLVSDWNDSVPAVFGAGREAANTSTNIVRVNRALADGNYYYVFDRCRELGSDSVIVKISSLEQYGVSVTALDSAAKASGYEVEGQNASYRLYHMDTYDNWGTISSYDAIGIGSGAPMISQSFPAVEETDSYNLNDYTYEQLSSYKEVILDGFTYDDKEAAEELLIRLSESGVKVVIYADGIPQNKKTHSQEFLGVTCNAITFQNGYPDMDTKIGMIYPDLFPKGYATWQTVYINGLDDTWGTIIDNGLELDFYGTVKNENIIVCGLNLSYYYGVSKDKTVGKLLEDTMDISSSQLPDRENIELEIKQDINGITISSEEDNVNTSIAYHDIFVSQQQLGKKNNLMYVNSGQTNISFKVPYLWQGIVVSAAGFILSVLWILYLKGENKKLQKAAETAVEAEDKTKENVEAEAAIDKSQNLNQPKEDDNKLENIELIEIAKENEDVRQSPSIQIIDNSNVEELELIEEIQLLDVNEDKNEDI